MTAPVAAKGWRRLLPLALLMGVLAALLWWPMQVDFYSDEGYFAEMTRRVLRGELPNVDFATNYLGLFYVYNALWFWLLGESLWSLRVGMWVLTVLLYVPVLYGLSRCLFTSRWWSALAVVAVFSATVLMNNSVHGNWYAVYACLGAVFAMWRSACVSTGERRWLLVAGVMLGVGFLMKHTVALSTGLGLLVFELLSALGDRTSKTAEPDNLASPLIAGRTAGFWLGLLIVSSALLAAPVVIFLLVRPRLDAFRLLFYVLPVALISLRLLKSVLSHWRVLDFARIARRLLLLAAGAALPVSIYLACFLQRPDGVTQLLTAVFIDYPRIYLAEAFLDYATMIDGFAVLCVAMTLVLAAVWRRNAPVFWLLLSLGLAFAVLNGDVRSVANTATRVYLQAPLWMMALGAAWFWQRVDRLPGQPSRGQVLNLSLWVLGVYGFLGTYPLGMMFYTTYSIAPLMFLLLVLLRQATLHKPWRLCLPVYALITGIVVMGVCMAYRQIAWSNPAGAPVFPAKTFPVYLDWPQGKIRVAAGSDYGAKMRLYRAYIARVSRRDDDIFMMSDGPQVYFVTNHRNPTRYSYAIDSRLSDGRDIVDALERRRTQWVFVEPGQNGFSQPLLKRYLAERFVFKEAVSPEILVFERR